MLKKLSVLIVLFVSVFTVSVVSSSFAADSEPRRVSKHGDWGVYVFNDESGNKVCYMSSQPKKSEGKYSRRGEVIVFITHWTVDNTKNVVSVSTGYPYKTGSEASILVDGRKFKLFTRGETAWAEEQETDDALVASIKRGSKMVLKGTSKRGNLTTDTFSLKGSTDAYKALNRACSS